MKCLFYYIDFQTDSGYTSGLGLSSISGYVKKFGHATDLVYYKFADDFDYGIEKIKQFKPDLIGFYSTSAGSVTVRKLSSFVREKFPHIVQIYGGINAILVPEIIGLF